MVARRPLGYSAAHIALHWIIAALVIFQLVMGDLIKPAYRAFERGTVPAETASLVHTFMSMSAFPSCFWHSSGCSCGGEMERLPLRPESAPFSAGPPLPRTSCFTWRSLQCRYRAWLRGLEALEMPVKSTNWPNRSSSLSLPCTLPGHSGSISSPGPMCFVAC